MLRAAALLALVALAAAAEDTTGKTVKGYTFGSDASGYALISKDVCAISKAVASSPADWATAGKVYANGLYSFASDGSARSLKSWASSADYAGEAIGQAFIKYFGNDSVWADTYVSAALAGAGDFAGAADAARAQGAKKGTLAHVQTAYMLHELQEGLEKVEAGEVGAAEGAPHNVDEAAAIYLGAGDPECAPYSIPEKRAAYAGTLVVGADGKCLAAANQQAVAALNAMREAALAKDAAGYGAALQEFVDSQIVAYSQATIEYAHKINEAGADDPATEATEGLAFYRTIAPWIAAADAAADKAILAAFEAKAPTAQADVQAAIDAAFAKLGLDTAQLGEPDALANPACAAAPAPPPGGASGAAAPAAAAAALAAALLLAVAA